MKTEVIPVTVSPETIKKLREDVDKRKADAGTDKLQASVDARKQDDVIVELGKRITLLEQ
ncbi:MAG TPA: hypothetical protein ENH60_05950 [Pricia sp.]|nr:hypothetical protein [Pricia sp.]